VAQRFLAAVVEQARRKGLLSDEHFTVDGTLLNRRSVGPKADPPARGSGKDGQLLLLLALSHSMLRRAPSSRPTV
jgi:hypothetical protein